MAFDALLARQQTSSDPCIACPTQPPSCPCNLNTDQCVLIENSCTACSHFICQPLDSGSSGGSSGGVSSGAVAGAVVAVILALGIAVAGFIFYRRRQRQKRLAEEADAKPDSPARAEDVLNRPDPNEKPPSPPPPHSASYASTSGEAEAQTAATSAQATQGHASNPRASVQSNPFGDSHSIQTTDTGNQSNVIPIALVAPSPRIAAASGASSGYGPMRPVRTPDIHLEPLGQPSSAAPGANPNRASYMTTGSYASDLLGEAPVIITPTRGAVKQVLGVVKAEVIRAPSGPSASGVAEGLRPPPIRAPMRSPLAASSFGPSDVVQEVAITGSERNDPFGDEHASDAGSHSPAPSHSTFGSPGRSPRPAANEELGDPRRPWANEGSSRPSSISTQAGSIIGAGIVNATRVHVGLDQLGAAPSPAHTITSLPRSPYRMTSGRLVTPPVASAPGAAPGSTMQQQQQRALAELARDSRVSVSSVLSTSTRADSILESFPFVPPSPISNRPIRTPPRSPLAQQSFANAPSTPAPTTPVPHVPEPERAPEPAADPLTPPPSRKTLGMSIASQSSAFSTGLGSFPFQIDSGAVPSDPPPGSSPPSAFHGRQRASLDTLALTSDLSSYPLGFDRAAEKYPPSPRR